jgi:hypothetical protein
MIRKKEALKEELRKLLGTTNRATISDDGIRQMVDEVLKEFVSARGGK